MKDQSETGSVRHFALFVTIAIAIFAGGSGVVLVQHLFTRMEPPQLVEDSTHGSTLDPQLADALLQLAKELRESRAAPSQMSSPSTDSSPRRVVTDSGESALSELALAVRELRAALQASGGASPASSSGPTRPRNDLRAWLPELAADVQDHEAAYTRQHMFWTEQQIVDSYGMPDSIDISDNGSAIWWYRDPDEDKRSFYVRIFQGRVVSVRG